MSDIFLIKGIASGGGVIGNWGRGNWGRVHISLTFP